MIIGIHEAKARKAVIDALEQQADVLAREIYNRKANLLQTFYEFEMLPVPIANFRGYTDNIFVKGDKTFADIDDALEFAETDGS